MRFGCIDQLHGAAPLSVPQTRAGAVVAALLLFGALWPPTAVPAPYWACRAQEEIETAAKAAQEVLKALAIVILQSAGISDLDP